MAKTVIKGRGAIVHGPCPGCSETVSVFLEHGESFKDSECKFCGKEVHGDGIYDIIREGRSRKKKRSSGDSTAV